MDALLVEVAGKAEGMICIEPAMIGMSASIGQVNDGFHIKNKSDFMKYNKQHR
jgi:hypothetical protein